MLPGNLQYWEPCKWYVGGNVRDFMGTIRYNISEPIHFFGPSPGYQSAIAEEDKKEQPHTFPSDQPLVTVQEDPKGAAQQRPSEEIMIPVQKPIKEETKQTEPSQIVEPTGGAAMSAPSIDAPPRFNQQPIE